MIAVLADNTVLGAATSSVSLLIRPEAGGHSVLVALALAALLTWLVRSEAAGLPRGGFATGGGSH
jgi:hypothetical protein